jgi:hypothetical protein
LNKRWPPLVLLAAILTRLVGESLLRDAVAYALLQLVTA